MNATSSQRHKTIGIIIAATMVAGSVGSMFATPASAAARTPWPGVAKPGADEKLAANCGVKDGKLWCTNRVASVMSIPWLNAYPGQPAGTMVDTLRTTYSWFDCWAEGEATGGASGEGTTWYHTVGDDHGRAGYVYHTSVNTPSDFDEDPSHYGPYKLRKC